MTSILLKGSKGGAACGARRWPACPHMAGLHSRPAGLQPTGANTQHMCFWGCAIARPSQWPGACAGVQITRIVRLAAGLNAFCEIMIRRAGKLESWEDAKCRLSTPFGAECLFGHGRLWRRRAEMLTGTQPLGAGKPLQGMLGPQVHRADGSRQSSVSSCWNRQSSWNQCSPPGTGTRRAAAQGRTGAKAARAGPRQRHRSRASPAGRASRCSARSALQPPQRSGWLGELPEYIHHSHVNCARAKRALTT